MKIFVAIFSTLLLLAAPAHAVLLQVTQSNGAFIEFNQGGTTFDIRLDTLRQGSDALREVDLTERVQAIASVRLLRAELPLDEPTRMVDPGGFAGGGFGEKFYWCDIDGVPKPGDDVAATHVCAQSDIVEDVFWDGNAFILTIRLARDCNSMPDFISCQ